MRKIFLIYTLIIGITSYACTNVIVGKKASKDGSVFITYSADSYGAYGIMHHFPATKHAKGDKRIIRDWESNKLLGEIEEVSETYNVVGNINEYQVAIGETTFGGREELVDTTGIIDYGSLIFLALQRAKTAREAIKVMTSLVEKYGYYSEGESFSIADANEAWIMEMIGKGVGNKGAVWVAVRIPDDCISAHANQSRIHKFMHYNKKDCMYSKDVISFARSKGYFNGKDEDFDFANAYCPLDFGGARYCEARVWSFYNMFKSGMDKYFDYSAGLNLKAEPLPLFVKPDKLLTIQDVQTIMRDHFDGTPLDMTQDRGAGVFKSPYRPRPLSWEQDGNTYFNERPIGTQQSSFSFIAQMRENKIDPIGGVLWFTNDDAHTTPYTPVYCCATQAPDCYTMNNGNAVKFSIKSAFWVQNWVSNMVYPRYSQLFPDVKKERDMIDEAFLDAQAETEANALKIYEKDHAKAVEYLTNYSVKCAELMLDRWTALAYYLIVKYNDMCAKVDDGKGSFKYTSDDEPIRAEVANPGYPIEIRKQIIDETGDKFLYRK